MKTKLFVSLIVFLAIAAMTQTSVQAQNWEVIGKKTVDFAVDHDEMIVTSTRGDFKAIKIRVTKAPLNMHRCVIHFGNGSQQEVDLRHNFTPGSESRIIDLNGTDRVISRITFWYDTKNHAPRKAVVTVFAKN